MKTTAEWFNGRDWGLHLVGGPHDPSQRGHTKGTFTGALPKDVEARKCEECRRAEASR